MKDTETKSFKKTIKLNEKQNKTKINIRWIMSISILSFIISMIFSFLSEIIMENVNVVIATLIVVIFIIIGIAFDMLGVAITSSDEKPFHAMSAKKIKGASIAVNIQKNADKMSSFCNDVIGDICGIMSGSAGVYIALKLGTILNINKLVISLLVTSIIAALTIGGKALGKTYAINRSTSILFSFSKFISKFYNPETKYH